MALYIPLSRRRRHAAIVAAAALLIGLIAGVVIGRTSATTASEAAADVRERGDTLATRVSALTIEYDQAVGAGQTGGTDTIQGGVLDALDLVDSDLDDLIGEAPWIGKAQSELLHEATAAVRTAAENRVTEDEFADVAASTSATIRTEFGFGD